tara:strand:- start:260 stop:583 length:324 start_codon:yes stop_codon:yes gene_type:complete
MILAERKGFGDLNLKVVNHLHLVFNVNLVRLEFLIVIALRLELQGLGQPLLGSVEGKLEVEDAELLKKLIAAFVGSGLFKVIHDSVSLCSCFFSIIILAWCMVRVNP